MCGSINFIFLLLFIAFLVIFVHRSSWLSVVCYNSDRLGTFCLQIIGRSSAPLFGKQNTWIVPHNCIFPKQSSVIGTVYVVHFF